MRHLFFIIAVFIGLKTAYGQDTVKVEKGVYLTKKEFAELEGRGYLGKYGREDVVFSPPIPVWNIVITWTV